jgi:transcriptional regulator with GAF, ATPase, and Fis domain
MEMLKRTIAKIAPTTGTVLITGETGVGKELVAKAIHQCSDRAKKPFLAVNCSALSEQLIESELFGHEKGSFTGAVSRRDGLFIEADQGVLFLDEIGEMPLALQAKLLRVLQEGEVRRVGSNHTMKVDIRLIAATNRDLAAQVKKGEFREDLFYRLNVINLHIEPLRNRKEDIANLANRFLEKHQPGVAVDRRVRLAPKTLEILERYSWPGNVRELENTIQRSLILADGLTILPRELPSTMLQLVESQGRPYSLRVELPYQDAKHQFLEGFDRDYVECVLGHSDGSLSRAAALAGMDRSNFRKLVMKTGIRYSEKTETIEEAIP